MVINIFKTAFLLASYLLLIPIIADAEDIKTMQMACPDDPGEIAEHSQYVLENWFTTTRRQSDEYLERIQQIESNEGVFSYELIPELIGLGLLYQEQANHAESADAFQRALYIIRVNYGLYSISQLPLLELLINSNSARQQWKQVADSYDMMYWLYRRNYAEIDPRQLPVIKRLRRWYIESYNKDTGRSLNELFTNAEKLYEQGSKIMWACTGGDKRQTACFWHKSCCEGAGTKHGACPVDSN